MTAARDALLARMDAGWSQLSARLDRLDPASLSRTTSARWTVGAMLSHIAAWHDATAYRIHRFAATGRPEPKVMDDDDAFNARVAAHADGVPAATVLAALRSSAGRLRDAVAALPGLDADGWVEAVVAGNTFGHYEEHLTELDDLG